MVRISKIWDWAFKDNGYDTLRQETIARLTLSQERLSIGGGGVSFADIEEVETYANYGWSEVNRAFTDGKIYSNKIHEDKYGIIYANKWAEAATFKKHYHSDMRELIHVIQGKYVVDIYSDIGVLQKSVTLSENNRVYDIAPNVLHNVHGFKNTVVITKFERVR